MRLRVEEGGETRTVVVNGNRARIGRQPECDVVLEDGGASREHAEIAREGNAWVVRDLGSRNGTFLNDEPIERERLAPGDVVRIGPDVRIELLAEEDESASDDRDDSRITDDEPEDEAAPRRRPARSAPTNWFMSVNWTLRPRAAGAALTTLHPGVTSVGRDSNAGLVLDDESVSRMHARLETRGADLVVIDLKSRNGTHVNDEAVVQTTLEPRDVLRFGDVAFRVERHVGPAWKRIGLIAGALIVLIAGALVLTQLSDWLGERGAIAGARKSMRQQAVENTRAGIAASRAGDAELTRAYLLHAADLLLLADLAPRGATLDQPREFFRDLLPALPEAEREFDFASALDPAAIASSEARLATLTNREYVEHQLRRYAVELNQDPNVPAGFVEQVWTYVDQYERFPAGMRTMLRRSRDLQPRIRSILASRHLPEAFCYVAWVESALDPMQMSGVGALGLWQIMPATARELGLQVVSGDLRGNIAARRQDQRTDIERSTAAAAEYVAKLLRDQGPEYFMLVLASYNRGPGAVDRAKQRVTDPMLSATRKFWYLSEHNLLPEETRNYVPRILAVRVIAESPERFGFEKP